MRSGQYQNALERLKDRANQQSDDGEVDAETLYLIAVNHRYLNEYNHALQTLQQLKLIAPDHSRAMQELGHLQQALNQPEKALDAFARATQLNPALVASWKAQARLLRQQGHHPQADSVEVKLKKLLATPKPLIAVMELLAQGKLVKAEELCRRFLQKNPTRVDGMRLLADIGSRLGMLEDAEFLLESALEIAPDEAEIRIDYLQVLRKRQKFSEALAQAKQLLESAPNNPQYQSLYAIECMQVGDYNTAIKVFDSVLTQLPDEPTTLTSKGHAHKTFGDQASAIKCYRGALASRARHCEAWYSLANLKTVKFEDSDIATMEALKDDSMLIATDHVYLNFALGKAYEDRKAYEQSFNHYQEGNRIKKAQSRYRAKQMSEEFDLQKRFCDQSFANTIASDGHPAVDPIFIVGLPRSGSTLLEQILSSHSMVDGTLELPNILSLAHSLRRGNQLSQETLYPENLLGMSVECRRELGETYMRDTQIHRQGAPFFIDKMPNNFRHIGLIKSILPNAKIIDARRDPMSCCFSGFKQLFAEGQEFTYDLSDIGQYYRDYVTLMDHWNSVFDEQLLLVKYEDVVSDTEQQVRRILDFCGLPFEQNCLEFHTTQRAVRTASSEQVRQPINQRGLDQWQHFEPWLKPLKQALNPPKEALNTSPTAA